MPAVLLKAFDFQSPPEKKTNEDKNEGK